MADGRRAVQMTPVDEPWQVVEDGEICVLAFEGGERGTMGISGARQLAGLLNERAAAHGAASARARGRCAPRRAERGGGDG